MYGGRGGGCQVPLVAPVAAAADPSAAAAIAAAALALFDTLLRPDVPATPPGTAAAAGSGMRGCAAAIDGAGGPPQPSRAWFCSVLLKALRASAAE